MIAALLAFALWLSAPAVQGSMHAANTPTPDVVSVKPCDASAPSAGRGGNTGTTSPGRIHLDCQSLFSLINTAYVSFANGRLTQPGERPDFTPGLTPVPDWVLKERFTIEATAHGDVPPNVLRGPMLQSILEDRFKLKVRVETREVPVDELVVAKGGAKLTPFKEGTCVPYDYAAYPQPPLAAGQRRCQNGTQSSDAANGSYVDTAEATTLDGWVSNLRVHSDSGVPRPVINKTGLVGIFSFRLVYRSNDNSTAPSFETAIRDQLGLELREAKGSRGFLVVDHVERPTPDFAAFAATSRLAAHDSKGGVSR